MQFFSRSEEKPTSGLVTHMQDLWQIPNIGRLIKSLSRLVEAIVTDDSVTDKMEKISALVALPINQFDCNSIFKQVLRRHKPNKSLDYSSCILECANVTQKLYEDVCTRGYDRGLNMALSLAGTCKHLQQAGIELRVNFDTILSKLASPKSSPQVFDVTKTQKQRRV